MMSEPPAEKKARMPMKFAYWSIRGLAQPIRLLLKYTGTEFEDIRYTVGDPPEYSRECWFSVKNTLGLDFPNLPYLIDGDLKLTQSNAILGYIARKHNLDGKNEKEKAIVHMLECQAMDFRNGFVRLCYNSNFDSMREDYVKNVKAKIEQFSEYLGSKTWFTGDEITYVDFVLYELLDQHRVFQADLIDVYPNIKDFLERFEALPAIKEYMSCDEFIRRPINNPTASWK